MPTQTPILGLYNPLDADDANTAVRVWRTADNAVLDEAVGTARQSLLTNGGMEVWQRGPGAFSTNLAYTADRWRISLSGSSTMSLARDAANADVGSEFCCAITYVHNVASNVQQVVEPFAQLRGRTCTFSCRVRTSVASAVRLSLYDSVNLHRYSGYHTGSGAYETLTVTAPIATATTAVWVLVYLSASCTAYLDSATLCVGASALAYAPLPPALDLVACQRYYFVIGGLINYEQICPVQAFAATSASGSLRFPVEMAITPTMTISAAADFACFSSNGAVTPLTGLSASNLSRRSSGLAATTAAGLVAGNASVLFTNNTLAARLAFEANP